MGALFLNIKEKRWQEMYNENEEIEKELTLSQYIDELDIPEEVLEDNCIWIVKKNPKGRFMHFYKQIAVDILENMEMCF